MRPWNHFVLAILLVHGAAAYGQIPAPYSSAGVVPTQILMPSLDRIVTDVRGPTDWMLRYAEANPDWRVGIARGRVVAHRRVNRQIALNGYERRRDSERRVSILWDAPSIARPAFLQPCVTEASAVAGAVDVNICMYTNSPTQRLAYLYVGADSCWVGLQESSSSRLPRLDDMMASVEGELTGLMNNIDAGKTVLDALPPGSMRRGPSELTLDGEDGQSLVLEAWLNPGEPGVVSPRFSRKGTGQPLTIRHEELYAKERVGYSTDPEEQFFANSLLWLNETATGWDTTHEVVVEMWFLPDSGEPERKLAQGTFTISGWER